MTTTGAVRRRIRMFSWGHVDHPDGDFTADLELARELREAAQFYAARRYFAPVLKQHTEDGYTYGRAVDVGWDDEGIFADTEVPQAIADAIDAGFIDSWSPSFYEDFKDPHSERRFRYVLRELSFVSIRHLKNLPGQSPYYTLAEADRSLAELATTEDTMDEELREMLAAIGEELRAAREEISGLREEVAALREREEAPPEEDGDDPGEGDDSGEGDGEGDGEGGEGEGGAGAAAVELAEQVARLEAELAGYKRRELSEAIRGQVGDVSEDTLGVLLALPQEQRDVMVRSLAEARPPAAPGKGPRTLGEVGTPGTPAPPATGGFRAAVASAKAAGIERAGVLDHLLRGGWADQISHAVISEVYGSR